MTVGVFDSGIGGLTVAKSLYNHSLFSEMIYYGDTARVPYGPKDEHTIIRYSLEALEFFKNFDIDLMITACNTVSAYALDELKKNGSIDVVGVIEPGVLAVENLNIPKTSNILILATKATVKSQSYQRLLAQRGYSNVTALATGLFVPFVEDNITDGPVMDALMNHYFKGLPHPDVIILGCTHFPLLQNALQRYFPSSILVHSGEAIVEYLETNYHLQTQPTHGTIRFFASENPEGLKSIAKRWIFDHAI